MGGEISQSYTECQGVNTLTVSIRLKDILILVPINVNSLNIFLNIMNVQISSLIYTQNAFHHPVADMLKLATLRPGLVRLAIFSIGSTNYSALNQIFFWW